MTEVSFTVSRHASKLINGIARRAVRMAAVHRSPADRRKMLDYRMDVTAVHANGCPLKLKELLEADDFNFSHDVFGIERHLDRETGQLTDHFRPRFAQQEVLTS